MYSSSNALNAAPDLQSTLLLLKRSRVCAAIKLAMVTIRECYTFEFCRSGLILLKAGGRPIHCGTGVQLRYLKAFECLAQFCASDEHPFIFRMVWTLPHPLPKTNQTSQRPLIPDLTIWRFKVNQLSQKIFLLSLFFVWFGRIPPVWSLRNNKFSPSDKSKESSTYQYLFSQQNLLILRFRAQRNFFYKSCQKTLYWRWRSPSLSSLSSSSLSPRIETWGSHQQLRMNRGRLHLRQLLTSMSVSQKIMPWAKSWGLPTLGISEYAKIS